MLMNGKRIEGPNEELIIIPRPEDPIVFTARAVLDMEEFDRLCPRPKPPIIRKKGGERIEELNDPQYLKKINEYGEKRMAYMTIKSLEATEGLEWETVQIGDPSSWMNWIEELRESGFSDIEVQRITVGVMSANCLNESKLEEARKLFLAGQQELKDLSSQEVAVSTMQSGDLASDLE